MQYYKKAFGERDFYSIWAHYFDKKKGFGLRIRKTI